MNTKIARLLLAVFCLGLVPAASHAQCKDQQDKHCWNMQYILYAAQTDFREFQPTKRLQPRDPKRVVPRPDVSVGAVSVPCSMTIWSSDVSVYMCTADIPAAEVEEWYGKTMADLQQLQYLWQFKINTAGTDHYVDAGPAGCDVATLEKNYSDGSPAGGPYFADGPYIGQCPLHLETVKQADGKAKVYFWLNSYSSPYLTRRLESPSKSLPQSAKAQAPQSASTTTSSSAPETAAPAEAPATAQHAEAHAVCDELCQGVKKILEGRTSSFRELDTTTTVADRAGAASSDPAVKLAGAASCSVNTAPAGGVRTSAKNNSVSRVHLADVSTKSGNAAAPPPPAPAAQYVCYWPENSATAAESQYHDLVGLVQMLMPTSWTANEHSQPDELSGADVTVWTARDARSKAAVGIYLNGKSVGLHISAAD